ncbi:uncharacterized protein [Aristolochia californica]|uniref:uncharacterized protein n=1 Tax=Aristolochia californica TaxID=171875 RepID=UPI0035E223A5
MREREKKQVPLHHKQTKQSGPDKGRAVNGKEVSSRTALSRTSSATIGSDLNVQTDSSDIYEEIVVHYMDDMDRSEESVVDDNDKPEGGTGHAKASELVEKNNGEEREDRSSDGCKDGESDGEAVKDSVPSHGESQTLSGNKKERPSRVPKKLTNKHLVESGSRAGRAKNDRLGTNALQFKTLPKKSQNGETKTMDNKSKNMKVHAQPPSESSEGSDDKANEEFREIDLLDEAPNSCQSVETDDEGTDTLGNGLSEDQVNTRQKIEDMELRIEKLEEELREIAALEISLYSVVPEHGSSAHKVHTPARRLSRLYIHSCKHWTQDKRASIARNTVSGLVLIAKSCGSDVARLTFWWSNIIVLREIISQAFNSSHQSNLSGRTIESNGGGKREGQPSVKWKANGINKQGKFSGFTQFEDDWQETSTFTAALEKIESWIFSRIVESVWWQTLTPHMQSPVEDIYTEKNSFRLLGPALGDQQQGSFSINLWKSAFQDAFQRLCPVRAGGHECGCLPVLARMVMEQCVARLDVAMFNAILRESAHEIPTDPVSDPIIDPKVLPIPAGDLSFGSAAQLKNSVGNWSRFLTDLFGMDADDSFKGNETNGEDADKDRIGDEAEPKSFCLLNALSDLLMLPKDMLADRSIRKEVCPTLGLPIIKRILCNFTPDEFCPDPVPGSVLEALNSESLLERLQSSDKDLISSFPCIAAGVVYFPPSAADVAVKIGDAGGHAQLERNVSLIQRKGYTSDEELDELDCPIASVIDKTATPRMNGGENGKHKDSVSYVSRSGSNVRYELLREVWFA